MPQAISWLKIAKTKMANIENVNVMIMGRVRTIIEGIYQIFTDFYGEDRFYFGLILMVNVL